MSRFEVSILGCSAAAPTLRHLPSSQVVNVNDKLYMIDCGEGAQLSLRRTGLNFNRMGHIFLSHLHGDHCFGLPGLLSTMGLHERSGEVVIHAHPDAERIFTPMLDYFCREMPFAIRFEPITTQTGDVIYRDKGLSVKAFPLKHRIPTYGFLFEEYTGIRHLKGEMVKFYNIPICRLNEIKEGADYVTPDGRTIPNSVLTTPPTPAVRYAYCCDTMYSEKIIPHIEGADVLYHDATYADKERAQAKQTFHSTARQAATIAQAAHVGKLIIGHFSARYKDESLLLYQAREVFENTVLANEGLRCILRK